MPNNNYKRGYALERNVKLYLESLGYMATRAAGSHGVYDVWATNGKSLWFVQCKIGASPAYAIKLLQEMTHEFPISPDTSVIPITMSVVDGMKAGKPHELARAEYGPKGDTS
jgi:hypothetical protein